ncbi:CPBP family intramembrane glutamic endopeptidase [Phytoactinopolyspora halophila]|uniref:CPBP family intramembrane glutamic endopeptidase n=1 Tax=Phytoactinopolyspora halophila TaxID=1981511 RepID=UPI001B8ACDBE|nr:CPBP family intramembrane glutamic endopeptidase [Phytoactinopolyspora halophila]
MASQSSQVDTLDGHSWRRLGVEVWIVLGLSLGQSAVYAAVRLIERLAAEERLSEQRATMNVSRSEDEYVDLTYQILGIGFGLVPVALALFLLSAPGKSTLRRIGLEFSRPAWDLATGAALAAVIGLPGLGLYYLGRALDMNVAIATSGLGEYWWTVPVLILAALQNALLEEVVAVGYLVTRLRQLGWQVPATIAASAALRGAYHLYQGYGMALGNVAMGVVFGWWFHRTGRVMPLVVAHTVLDVVSFVGYALFRDVLGLP